MAGPLVAVALPQEATYLHDLPGVDVLLTGIGKVAAAAAVARAIPERHPTSVLNVGTAGALHDGLEGAHAVGRVWEHDVDHEALGALIGEELVGEIVLDRDHATTLATGGVFVADPDHRRLLAARAHLVDMEGYAVAHACRDAGVPCRIVKVVSDTASEDAALSWKAQVDHTARQIAEAAAAHL